jgi:hypothetical protein
VVAMEQVGARKSAKICDDVLEQPGLQAGRVGRGRGAGVGGIGAQARGKITGHRLRFGDAML